MKVLNEGHTYTVSNFESGQDSQMIQFIDKRPVEEGSKELYTYSDGTTTEELLEVLIDRTNYLNNKFSCFENNQALVNLTLALMWFEKRTSDRKKRNVEGKNVE